MTKRNFMYFQKRKGAWEKLCNGKLVFVPDDADQDEVDCIILNYGFSCEFPGTKQQKDIPEDCDIIDIVQYICKFTNSDPREIAFARYRRKKAGKSAYPSPVERKLNNAL